MMVVYCRGLTGEGVSAVVSMVAEDDSLIVLNESILLSMHAVVLRTVM